MVDITEALEGQYLGVETVRNSPSKKCVVVSTGEYAETEYGKKISILVEIDGKKKTWRLNRDTLKNMSHLGLDTVAWIGAVVELRIVTMQGKDSIVGLPILRQAGEVYA